MRVTDSNSILNRQFTRFSKDCTQSKAKKSLIPFGLLALFTITMSASAEAGSFAALKESSLAFTPFEVAQLAPEHVQILEGVIEDPNESRVQFTERKLRQAGYIIPESSHKGIILKNLGDHDSFSTGEIVYLDLGTEHAMTKGKLLTIFSKSRLILHPIIKGREKEGIPDYQRPLAEPYPMYFSKWGKRIGNLVEPLGYLEIIEAIPGSSKAIVRESYNPIHNGDFVAPYEKMDAPPRSPEAKGELNIRGHVIAFQREHYLGGLDDYIFIDKGTNDQVIPGDRFEVYITPTKGNDRWYEVDSTGKPMIPHVIAEIQVLDTQRETATGIVVSGMRSIPLGAAIRYKPVDIITPPLDDVLALAEAPTYEVVEVAYPIDETTEIPFEEEESFADEPFANFDPEIIQEETVEEARLMEFTETEELVDVHFSFDKYILNEVSRKALEKNAAYLLKHPNVQVQIEAHCDERGTNNYNLALAERRATAVKKFMAGQGIEENRMHLISYGEEKPFCEDSNEDCWQQNRKVHFNTNGSDLAVN
jgi:peptidoglycan-associated lipoprotein